MNTLPRTAPPSVHWGWLDGLRYGLMGLPLALCALPLYVYMPHWYATHFGVSLASLGALLLALRLLDAFADPWIGRWCDRWTAQGWNRLWAALVAASGLLALAFAALFHPLVGPEQALWWAGLTLACTHLAYSVVTVGHQSWGAALGGDATRRSAVVAWREGLGLLGVVLASLVPSLFGVPALGAVMAVGLLMAGWALHAAPYPQEGCSVLDQDRSGEGLRSPWRQPAFARLAVVFAVNGIASAVPATLVLFFIQDRLQAPAQWQGVFLGVYFLLAALSMPLWVRIVARMGLVRAWLLGMGVSIAAFLGTAGLGAGDLLAYGVVCAASGLALGSDLAIPGALLAQVAQERPAGRPGPQAPVHGVYFGWWNFIAKLNLALAAGLTLPLLAALGYVPGAREPVALQALTFVYCLLPCALKTLAAIALHLFFVRKPGGLHHAT